MRLICPNCDAQYEVDSALIPPEGRDVQCSDCGHVWFQAPDMGFDDDDDETAASFDVPVADAPASPRVAPAEPALAAASDEAGTAPERDDDSQVMRRHRLDESLMAVLREEAERETRARAEEASRAAGRSLEMQPDLGLPEVAPSLRIRPRETPSRLPDEFDDRTDDDKDDDKVEPAPRPSRRELLPDIDRINSTLDASSATRRGGAAVSMPAAPEQKRRSGFRAGFLLVLVLAAFGWAVYDQAPRLTQSMPQAEGWLTRYVAGVDKARLGLDGMMQGLLARLRG